MKIPEGEKSDLGKLSEKIKDKYCSYEENTKDFKMVDFASKVTLPSGIAVSIATGLALASPVALVGGGVISFGLGIYFTYRKSNMKLKSP